MDNAKMPKNAEKFVCESCMFNCNKLSNYLCHLETLKHSRSGEDNKMVINGNKKMPKNAVYICNCGNTYKYLSGLSRHKKHCNIEEDNPKTEHINIKSSITPSLVMELIQNNKELHQIILDQHTTLNNLVKMGVSNTTSLNSNNNNNNNNKTHK